MILYSRYRSSRAVRYGVYGSLALLILGLGFLYVAGYRIGKTGIAAPGEVSLFVPEKDSIVYVDGKKNTVSKEPNQTLSLSLSPRKHSILVAKEGYWPWQKDVTLGSREHITFRAFSVSKSVGGLGITGADPEYGALVSLVRSARLPSKNAPLVSADKNLSIWVEGLVIKGLWNGPLEAIPSYFCEGPNCTRDIDIITVTSPIRDLAFYKDRSDVVIVAFKESIAALEVDTRGIQNFQPIYSGASPSFAISPSGAFLVIDGNALMELSL